MVEKKLRNQNGNENGDEVETAGKATHKATDKECVGERAYEDYSVVLKFKKSTMLKADAAPPKKIRNKYVMWAE